MRSLKRVRRLDVRPGRAWGCPWVGRATGEPLGVQVIVGVRVAAVCLALGWLALGGCSQTRVVRHEPIAPGKTFTGPEYLHGTVGSLARLQGYEPTLVSGYGLVVNLRGTGSSDVPAFIRTWLVNEMRKKGVGSAAMGGEALSADRLLASPNTAVVLVQGLIPAGATRGARFDLLVTALPQTQTTSLEGGTLWTADLSVGGAGTPARFGRVLAQGWGATYLNPLDEAAGGDAAGEPEPEHRLRRQAAVLSGGVSREDMPLSLLLNQPSWQRSRLVADRINERFPKGAGDRFDAAVPKTDRLIDLNVPRRYAGEPSRFLELLAQLYTQRGTEFEPTQAQTLLGVLEQRPNEAGRIVNAIEALGKTTIPVIRRYYDHPTAHVRLAALEAGARLGDEMVTGPLLELAQGSDRATRGRVARMLGDLPRSIRGARILHTLLDDEDTDVRIAAYESLARAGDPIIQRHVVGEPPLAKFALDLVPAHRPLIYIAQERTPRLVIFNPDVAIRTPLIERFWDNRLMLRSMDDDGAIEVFYQAPGSVEPTIGRVGVEAAALAAFLAHRPTRTSPAQGLDLTYGEVAQVIYQLCRRGQIEAETRVQLSPLAAAVAQADSGARPDSARPETDHDATDGEGGAAGQTGQPPVVTRAPRRWE